MQPSPPVTFIDPGTRKWSDICWMSNLTVCTQMAWGYLPTINDSVLILQNAMWCETASTSKQQTYFDFSTDIPKSFTWKIKFYSFVVVVVFKLTNSLPLPHVKPGPCLLPTSTTTCPNESQERCAISQLERLYYPGRCSDLHPLSLSRVLKKPAGWSPTREQRWKLWTRCFSSGLHVRHNKSYDCCCDHFWYWNGMR